MGKIREREYIKIISDYTVGDMVYLKTDDDQLMRIITAICVRENGVSYELSCGSQAGWHYACEMSFDKRV